MTSSLTAARRHALFVALLGLSLVLRLMNLGGDLGGPSENKTAVSLIANRIFEHDGGGTFMFAPVQTFWNAGDRGVVNTGMRTFDADGRGYYTNEPPLCVLLPYVIGRILGQRTSVEMVQLLSLALHLLSAVFFYRLLRDCAVDEDSAVPAAAGAGVYLLATMNLWHCGNVYDHELVWLYFWLVALYLLWPLATGAGCRRGRYAAGAACVALSVFANFQALFPVLAFAAMLLVTRRLGRGGPVIVLGISAAVPLTLTTYLYGSQVGAAQFFSAMTSGASRRVTRPESVARLGTMLGDMIALWFPVLIATVALIGVAAAVAARRGARPDSPRLWQLFLLTTAASLLHGIVMLDSTANHADNLVKWTVPLGVLLTIWLRRATEASAGVPLLRYACFGAVAAMFAHEIVTYHRTVVPLGRRAEMRRIGEQLARVAAPEQTIVAVTDIYLWSPVMYFAERNVVAVSSPAQAGAWQRAHPDRPAVVVTIEKPSAVGLLASPSADAG